MDLAVLFFQVLENARGRFDLLSLEYFKGRRLMIYIPEGFKGKGWGLLAGELSGLLYPPVVSKKKGKKELGSNQDIGLERVVKGPLK